MKRIALLTCLIARLAMSVSATEVAFEYHDVNSEVKPGRVVALLGTFNSWYPTAMERDTTGTWRITINLDPGREYEYKFAINTEGRLAEWIWVFDPNAPVKNSNSVIFVPEDESVSESAVFQFEDSGATRVTVMGDFNNWNPVEFPLQLVDKRWRGERALPTGMWRFRFVVDSQPFIQKTDVSSSWWVADSQPFVSNLELVEQALDYDRSMCNVKFHRAPTTLPACRYTFRLFAPHAVSVHLAGQFNEWNPGTLPLEDPDGDGMWETSVILNPGVYQYKYWIDGTRWITSPSPEAFYHLNDGIVNSVAVVDRPYKSEPGADDFESADQFTRADTLTRYAYFCQRGNSLLQLGLVEAARDAFGQALLISDAIVQADWSLWGDSRPWYPSEYITGPAMLGKAVAEFELGNDVEAERRLWSNWNFHDHRIMASLAAFDHGIGAYRRFSRLRPLESEMRNSFERQDFFDIGRLRRQRSFFVGYSIRDIDAFFSTVPGLASEMGNMRNTGAKPRSSQLALGGWLQHRLGNDEKALLYFQKALEVDPGSADVHYYRGLLHRDRGETEAARREFQEAVALNPHGEFARYFLENPAVRHASGSVPGIYFAGLRQKGNRLRHLGQSEGVRDMLADRIGGTGITRFVTPDDVSDYAIEQGLAMASIEASAKLQTDFARERNVPLAAALKIAYEGPSINCLLYFAPVAEMLAANPLQEDVSQVLYSTDTFTAARDSSALGRDFEVTDTITRIYRRRQARLVRKDALVSRGIIGETPWGSLGFSHEHPPAAIDRDSVTLVEDENRDRNDLLVEFLRQRGLTWDRRWLIRQEWAQVTNEMTARPLTGNYWMEARPGKWVEVVQFRVQGRDRLTDMADRVRDEILKRLPIEAEVASVENGEIFFRIGQDQGIAAGTLLEHVRPARDITDAATGEVFHIEAKTDARFRLTDVYPRLSRAEILEVDRNVTVQPGLRARLVRGRDDDEQTREAGRLSIHSITMDPIFPAVAATGTEVGRIEVRNTDSLAISNMKVSIMIPGFMDLPSEIVVERILPDAALTLPLSPVFNEAFLRNDRDQVRQAKISLTWEFRRQKYSEERVVPVRILGRNAMTWQNKEMVGAFVNPQEPAVISFRTQIFARADTAPFPFMDRALSNAVVLFEAMKNIRYVSDPNAPYIGTDTSRWALDYVQLPAETLDRGTGDCDDLAVLYSTLLEAVGIPTRFLLTPGHILVEFKTGIDAGEWEKIGLPKNEVFIHDGKVWLAVETTLSEEGFLKAVSRGARETRQLENHLRLADAWRTFRPAALPTTGDVVADWQTAWTGYMTRTGELRVRQDAVIRRLFEEPLAQHPRDTELRKAYGAFLWSLGRDTDAETQWLRIGEVPESEGEMKLYLAVLELRRGNDAVAVALLRTVATQMPGDYRPSLNLARLHAKANRMSEARQAFERAVTLRSELRALEPEIFGAAASSRSGEVPVWQEMVVTRASDISESESTEVSW